MTRTTLAVILIFSTVTVLTGCSKPDQSESSQSAEAQLATESETPLSEADIPVGRLEQAATPSHYRLELKIDPRQERFSGTVAIDVDLDTEMEGLWIHGNQLDVSEAWVSQSTGERVEATYEQVHSSGVSRLTFEKPVAAGAATLNMAWSSAFTVQPEALFRAQRGEDAYVASQFQAISARRAYPGFDEPGFKTPFDITLVTPVGDVAITNTPEKSAVELEDGFVRREFETTRPLPTYLLAFAVGPYDLVDYGEIPPNSVRERPLPLRAIAARGQGERLNYALENTAGLLGVLEEYFGTEYPFRKLDLIALPMAAGFAMENAGAITYDEFLLLMDENSALDQRRAYTSVHAHELGHMWFGDLVTPDWWTDIWLNESFATWIAYKASQAFWPAGEFDRSTLKGGLAAMNSDSLAAARQIREPVTHNDAILDAFDGITYSKGGAVLAMLERYTGEEAFRDGIRLHMDRYADGVANAEDFIASVAEGSGKPDIEAAFKSYIEQPGVPLLEVSVNCDEGGASLDVRQSRYAPLGSSIDPSESQWLVPMCVSYIDGSESRSECAMLRESQQTIPLAAENCPSSLHPNADGAGYYRFALEESWWEGLIEGLPSMPAKEALVLAESLDAAFEAGAVSAQTYLQGMTGLVNHDVWDVVEAGIDNLEFVAEILVSEELPAFEAAMVDLARPRYERLAQESGDAAELLKSRLQRFLLVVARDPQERASAVGLAAQRIGMDGDPDLNAVPQSELETVLSVGVQDLGAPFFERLLEQALASEDPAFRGDALGALARTEDPALAKRLQELVLEKKLQGNEPLYIIVRQMARQATTELTYQWLRDNLDAVIELVPESFRGGFIAGRGSAFCSAERAEEWSSLIRSNADKLPGYERSLAQAVESANLCAALREAKAAELMAALEN